MTRMPHEPHPLEPLGPYVPCRKMSGAQSPDGLSGERPGAFIWNNAEHRILRRSWP